jgi:hypothetical protein
MYSQIVDPSQRLCKWLAGCPTKSRTYGVGIRKEYEIQAVMERPDPEVGKAEKRAQHGKFPWRRGMADVA